MPCTSSTKMVLVKKDGGQDVYLLKQIYQSFFISIQNIHQCISETAVSIGDWGFPPFEEVTGKKLNLSKI